MIQKKLNVKDQFGAEYSILATIEKSQNVKQLSPNIRYITVDDENIRPNFDLCFQSQMTNKIFKII